MTRDPLITALVYDFDGTLAPGNIQEHSLIPNYLGAEIRAFWEEVKAERKRDDADMILVYLREIVRRAQQMKLPITRAILAEHGAATPLFAGVAEWFDRIDEHAAKRGLRLEHYVISSGNEEMISATAIASKFRRIYASKYVYDADGHATWPAVAINYTTKTQYLFRINKGVENHWDDDGVNRWQPMKQRRVPFSRMIYLGDGDTDIPSMKMVRFQGGHSIAVFDPAKWSEKASRGRVHKLIAEDRAAFVVPADYTEGSQLDITVKGILGRIARDEAGYTGGADDL